MGIVGPLRPRTKRQVEDAGRSERCLRWVARTGCRGRGRGWRRGGGRRWCGSCDRQGISAGTPSGPCPTVPLVARVLLPHRIAGVGNFGDVDGGQAAAFPFSRTALVDDIVQTLPAASVIAPSSQRARRCRWATRSWLALDHCRRSILINLAKLAGVTPHTLRRTLGSAAVSSGETLAMTGAILGRAKMRPTSVYAHMQTDPTKVAARSSRGAHRHGPEWQAIC